MHIQSPTDRERAHVRRALLAVADELGVDHAEPLALPMFFAHAGLVVRELLDEQVRIDRRQHELTYTEIGTAFGITMQSAHARLRDRSS